MFDSIKQLLGIKPKQPRVLTPEEREAIAEDLANWIRREIASGSSDAQSIRENMVDLFADELGPEDAQSEVDVLLPKLMAEHIEAQKSWPGTTDCDRLDRAFDDLESEGIYSRQNYWCCQSCALSDVSHHFKQSRKAGAEPRGYVFYHEQDTENAAEGGGLFLAFGSREKGKEPSVAIAREVMEKLGSHGLRPEWDGDLDQRIFVPVDWKRRTPLPRFY